MIVLASTMLALRDHLERLVEGHLEHFDILALVRMAAAGRDAIVRAVVRDEEPEPLGDAAGLM